jgi:CRP-like cAMP-binding protein
MDKIERLKHAIHQISGMEEDDFVLSIPLWQHKHYRKGEFYNEYKNVCKYLGFVLSGVFRIYKFHEQSATERNMLFFTQDQFMSSFKSFLSQTSCEYFTESMTESDILYIHYDDLQHLYRMSPAWERFGRVFAEAMLHGIMNSVEGLLFKTPEDRYAEMLSLHPDILQSIPLYHIASYLGIEGPSLSRIRKRMSQKQQALPGPDK